MKFTFLISFQWFAKKTSDERSLVTPFNNKKECWFATGVGKVAQAKWFRKMGEGDSFHKTNHPEIYAFVSISSHK